MRCGAPSFHRLLAAASFAFICACGGGGAGKGAADKPGAPAPTPTPEPLVLSASSNLITTANTATLKSVGGTAPVTWTLLDGPGTVSGDTVTPSGVGNIRVKGKDAGAQNAVVTITVVAPLAAPVPLLEMIQGTTTQVLSVGGVPPITATVASGPITYALGNILAGSSAGAAVLHFADRIGNTADLNVTVAPPVSLAGVTDVGINQSVQLTAAGGFPPYTYSVVSGAGSLSTDGIFTATGTAGAVIVRAIDRLGNMGPKTLNVVATVAIVPATATIAVSNSITFTGGGGAPPYSYSVISGGGSVNSVTGVYTAGGMSGTAQVRLTDSAGNTAIATVTVTPALAIAPVTVTVLANGAFSFTTSGGVPPVSYAVVSGGGTIGAGGAYTAPAAPGAAIVRASDSLGNISDASVTIVPPVRIAPTTLSLAVTNAHTFTAADGAPPYVFSIVSGGGSINASTGVFTAGGSAGTSVVRVTDSLSSTADATVTVNPALAVTPSAMELLKNEIAAYMVSGGVPPVTYQVVSGPATVDANNVTAGNSAGAAVVRFTDSLNNIVNLNVTVADALTLSSTGAHVAINASMTFAAAGGFSPYTYTKQSGVGAVDPVTGVFLSATAGGATLLVTDRLGHTATAGVTVHSLPSISPTTVSITAGNTTTFSAAGGLAPYLYSVVSGGGTIDPATGAFTAPGAAATVIVRLSDALGSSADATVTVTAPLTISPATLTLLQNGTAAFSVTGGVAPISYAVTSGGGSIDAVTGAFTAPATAQTVTVQAEDSIGNTDTATVTVVPPVQITPATKTLAVNNAFTFGATDGIAPYAYAVVAGGGSINAATGAFIAPAAAGTVTVRVTDAAGSQSNATVTVNAAFVVSPAAMELVKSESASYATSGGVPPVTSQILSGTASVADGNITAGTTAGTAVVRFSDSLSNNADVTVTIADTLSLSAGATDIAINSNLTFTGAGGFTAYAFSKVSGVGTIDSATGVYTSAAAGTATLRVTDRLGHTADRVVTVHASPVISPATLTLAVLNTTIFSVVGGMAPYVYSIQSGGGTIDGGTGFFTAPMAAGTTVVRVTDALGNFSDATVTVNAALAISPVTSTMNTNATLSLSTTGGVPPVTYTVQAGGGSIGVSTGSYTAGASAGAVTLRATDARGNTSDAAVTVVVPVSISPATRTLAVNNTATFSGIGGQAPYTFSKVSGVGAINASTGVYTAPASAGSAVVRVTDNLGATADATITVNAALAISPTTKNLFYAGTQTFTGAGGVTPYIFSVVSGGGSINASTGAYTAPGATATVTVRVTDAYGNTANGTVNVTPALTISPTSATLAVNNNQTFTGGGGQSPYTFSKVSGLGAINASTGVYTAPASAGSAVVRVTDNLGNTTDANLTVNAALAISPATTYALVNGSRSFSATGGVTPYAYSVVSGGGSITGAGGVYTAPAAPVSVQVRVTDAVGNTSNAALEVVDPLTITPATLNILVNDNQVFTGVGGQAPYAYSVLSGVGAIDPADGTYSAPATPGAATVRVTDNLGLTANSTITVYQPLTISPTTITLAPDNTMTFAATGGLGAVTFSITAGGGNIDPATGDFQAPSSAGTVSVRVTDSIGNTADATVTVNGALSISPVTFKIATGLTKTFTVTNGVPPYTMSVPQGLGSVNTATKVFTAGALTEDVIVRVTDSIGNIADAEVEVVKPTRLVSGGYNNCLIHEDGSLRCWGDSASGQLGMGSTADRGDAASELGSAQPFMDLGTGRTVKDLAIGTGHMCAILDNDLLKCWGLNTSGQLGLGDVANRGDGANEMGDNLPYVDLGSGRTAKKIFVGATHSCAILDNNDLKCWGLNTYGQLGLGDVSTRGDGANEMGNSLPVVSLGTGRYAKSVALGSVSTCAILDNNTMKCWGRNNRGQSLTGGTVTRGDGAGEMGDALPASNVGTGRTLKAITAGVSHFCAILDNDLVKCWGQGTSGVLGSGATAHLGDAAGEVGDGLPYVSLASTGTVVAIASHAGASATCAQLSTGAIKCWGLNTYGQLGQNNTTTRGDSAGEMGDLLVATDLGTGFNANQFGVGTSHGCAMNASRQIKCWGRALNGTLGNASTTLNLGDAANEMGDFLPFVNY